MKIGVVGTGFVGATCAYALVMRGVGREVVLVDKNKGRAEAEADDIFHAVPFSHPLRVNSGEYADLSGSRVVIVAAGVNQRPGESRPELLQRNAAVFRDVIPGILGAAPEAVLLVVTNPVDIMTHIAAKFASDFGVPPTRVLGSGTTLDTARFRVLLGEHLGVDSYHVHAYVLGEHGDSEVLAWSSVKVAGIPLPDFCRMRNRCFGEGKDIGLPDGFMKQEIDRGVRQAAYHIIEGKGATYYGIGSAVAQIVNVILRDQRSILTVTALQKDVEGIADVSLSLPTLVGGEGVLGTFPPSIDDTEKAALRSSAQIIKDMTSQVLPG